MASRIRRLTGHCHHHQDLAVDKLVFWEPIMGIGEESSAEEDQAQPSLGTAEDRFDWNVRLKTRRKTT